MKQILVVLCALMIFSIFLPHDVLAKKFTINLSESLNMSTNDKKPKSADTKKDTKPVKSVKEIKKVEPKKKATKIAPKKITKLPTKHVILKNHKNIK